MDQILAARQHDPKADVSDWERQIDQLVYALYDLTLEEIELVEAMCLSPNAKAQ